MRRDGDNYDDVEEGGSHPTTLQTMAMCELAERLRFASCDWLQAEEREGDGDDSGDNEHVNGCVRDPLRADTVDGQRWRLWGNNDNNDDAKKGGSHPTPLMMAMRELAARLRSTGILYASEASLSDHSMMMKRGVMSANYGLMPPFFFSN